MHGHRLVIAAIVAACSSSSALGRRNLGKAATCGFVTGKCSDLGGACQALEECRAEHGEEARFIGAGGFCDAEAGDVTFSECGCCYKKTPSTPEPIDVIGASDVDIRFEAQGIGAAFTGKPPAETNAPKPATWASFSARADGGLADVILRLGEAATQSEQGPWSVSIRGEVKLECKDGTCLAEAPGLAHSPIVDALIKPFEVKDSGGGEEQEPEGPLDKVFESAQIPVAVKLQIHGDPFGDELRELESGGGPFGQFLFQGAMTATVELRPSEEQRAVGIEPFFATVPLAALIDWRLTPTDSSTSGLVLHPWPFVERKRRLCLQPIRTKHRRCLSSIGDWCLTPSPFLIYSGAGMPIGFPGLVEQWGKVDVTFEIREWIDLADPTRRYQTLTEDEVDDLLREVNTEDCVEIFFVRKFRPSEMYGGGACFGIGSADAKLVISDEQEECGTGLMLLAHEVGHALGLRHPQEAGPTAADYGTVMCPSGWRRDNPRRNSLGNGALVSNPLITQRWGKWTPDNHDCDSEFTCGSCHHAIPDDTCP